MNFKIIVTTLLIGVLLTAQSQTGPGGIGNSSNNLIWLKVDDIIGLADGENINLWSDFSGNSNDFTQPTDSFTPEFQSGIVNGFPVVRFNKTNGRLRKTGFTTFPTSSVTTIFVNKNSGESSDGIISYASSGHHNDFLVYNSSNLNIYQEANRSTGVSINDNNWHIVHATWNSSDGKVKIWKDGNVAHSSTGFRVGSSITAGGSLALAGEQDNIDASYESGQAHFGDFTEVILYNDTLNFVENLIIANYLSAKYGQILAANDLYDEDDPANGNFDYEVAGIGRVDASILHDESQGSAILRILNPSDLNNNEYLIWGHNNGLQQAIDFTDVPASVEARFERVWRASEVTSTGTPTDVGIIDLRWDLTSLGDVTTSDLRLLVDTDNDGVFNDETPIDGAVNLGSNIYEFSGISALENNLRFTLATINHTNTPLPIELLRFTAEKYHQEVMLEWITASETNNAYFEVERSTDNQVWETISHINGAGNSSKEINYTVNDKSPLVGINLYRLKQVDFDGSTTYSQPVSVELNPSVTFTAYPNPTYDRITLSGNFNQLNGINIYNLNGQLIPISTLNPILSGGQISVDLSNLVSGTYLIVANQQTIQVVKQ